MKAEQIIEAPVRFIDRAFELPPDMTSAENPIHERLRTGVHRVEAGVVLLIGGLASGAAGVEAGGSVVPPSLLLLVVSGLKVAWNAGRLQERLRQRM